MIGIAEEGQNSYQHQKTGHRPVTKLERLALNFVQSGTCNLQGCDQVAVIDASGRTETGSPFDFAGSKPRWPCIKILVRNCAAASVTTTIKCSRSGGVEWQGEFDVAFRRAGPLPAIRAFDSPIKWNAGFNGAAYFPLETPGWSLAPDRGRRKNGIEIVYSQRTME